MPAIDLDQSGGGDLSAHSGTHRGASRRQA
jgi:hypothetical protein